MKVNVNVKMQELAAVSHCVTQHNRSTLDELGFISQTGNLSHLQSKLKTLFQDVHQLLKYIPVYKNDDLTDSKRLNSVKRK